MTDNSIACTVAAILAAATLLTTGCSNSGAAGAGSASASSSGSAPPLRCKKDEKPLEAAGLCGRPAGAGCFEASLPSPNRDATSGGNARPVRFTIENKTTAPLYFKAVPGARVIAFDLYASPGAAALSPPETQFCPVHCPEYGPVMDVDCGAPIPALVGVPPGAATSVEWSGRIEVEVARACDDEPERRCLAPLPARAGEYAVKFCAYSAVETGGQTSAASAAGYMARARPSGAPRCVTTKFRSGGREAVIIAFSADGHAVAR